MNKTVMLCGVVGARPCRERAGQGEPPPGSASGSTVRRSGRSACRSTQFQRSRGPVSPLSSSHSSAWEFMMSSGRYSSTFSSAQRNQCLFLRLLIIQYNPTSNLRPLLLGVSLRFPYLDRPEERFILEALKQLYQCDAIDR
jgi:hypothetical protein